MSEDKYKFDPLTVEPKIQEFWDKNDIYKKAKDKNIGKQKFYFLDGPPYTSGYIHIGHAWNKSLKDLVLRQKRMLGLDVWDRAGYDMHGLPTELKVEAKLGLKSKDEIHTVGMEKFTKECENFCVEHMITQNKDFQRLGVWMDFENAYQPIKKTYIEGVWWLIKKAHENKRLYEGKRTMTWCASCQTAAAKHELEYVEVTDQSIFVKFPIKDKETEFLIIWTTTPWTIPFNLAVMVNPNSLYVKVKANSEIWIVAKDLVESIMKKSQIDTFEIIEEFIGETLEHTKYTHPLNQSVDYQEFVGENERLHTVVLSAEHVETTSGSGLVHCAPGCGPEDYEVGHRVGLPAFNNIGEDGVFPESMKGLANLQAKKDDKQFIKKLEEVGALLLKEPVIHDYAHCWRCKKPVVFRTTKQWFFKVEDIKERMLEVNNQTYWVPNAAYNAFTSWLDNLRDNSITKQRFWGTPLPVWRCGECQEYDVIGDAKDLEEHGATDIPDNLHMPYIDGVTYKCSCGGTKKRLPDVLDVWVDSGTASWNCLDFPEREDLFKEMFPAEFILEGKDQIRGWFNLLMVAGIVSMDKQSFKNCYMHGFVQDAKGRKMSKSLGNVISPYEVIEKYGSDALRYYMIGGANPGLDMNYNFDDLKVRFRNMSILWNLHKLTVDMAKTLDVNPKEISKPELGFEEKYIFSKLNTTIKTLSEKYDKYLLNEIPSLTEEIYLELSRTYMQLVREKSSTGTDAEKETVLYTLYNVLLETIKLLAPIIPFHAEQLYQNLKDEFNLDVQSIHLFEWPKADESIIQTELESSMSYAQDIIQVILGARDKAKLGVRWPVRLVQIQTTNDDIKSAINNLKDMITTQTNVKELSIIENFENMSYQIKPNFRNLGKEFGQETAYVIEAIKAKDPNEVVKAIKENQKYIITFEGRECEITKDHINVEKEVSEPFVLSEGKGMDAFLDTTRTEELEAEGFMREITRRVQSLRKTAGLEKTDSIELNVKTDLQLVQFVEQIKEKVGASSLIISADAKELPVKSVEQVKDKEITISFSKLN